MAFCRHSLVFASVCLVLLITDIRPLLFTAFVKVVGSLVLACLLAFVAVHSVNIGKLLISCLKAFSVLFFPFAVESRISSNTADSHHGFNELSLRPLFQRPPPFPSL